MENWIERAKELLAVLERHPIAAVQTAEARERFKEILAGASGTTYVVKHYREPRAAVMSIEAFEAMRQLALLVSSLAEAAEPQNLQSVDADGEPGEWAATVAEAVDAVRAAPSSPRRFKNRPAKAM